MPNVSLIDGHIDELKYDKQQARIQTLEKQLKNCVALLCELCERCGENVCKNGEECDWKGGAE